MKLCKLCLVFSIAVPFCFAHASMVELSAFSSSQELASLNPLQLTFPDDSANLRVRFDEQGAIHKISTFHGASVSLSNYRGATALESVRHFLRENAASLGHDLERIEFRLVKNSGTAERSHFRFQEYYDGILVVGGQLIVGVDIEREALTYYYSECPSEADLSGAMRNTPGDPGNISAISESAVNSQETLQTWRSREIIPVLLPGNAFGRDAATELAWSSTVNSPDDVQQFQVICSATTGRVIAILPELKSCGGFDAVVRDSTTSGTILWEDGQGDVVVSGTGCPDATPCSTSNYCLAEIVNNHHPLLEGTYDFYCDQHGRDSVDDSGVQIRSVLDSGTTQAGGTTLYFNRKSPQADDIVAHEYTHCVTDYESDLLYWGQSGAINESFSDMWGEAFDLLNGIDSTCPSGMTSEPRWLIGDNWGGLPARSLIDPPSRSHNSTSGRLAGLDVNGAECLADYDDPLPMPDRLYGYGWFYPAASGSSCDQDGVHHNSSVGNKLLYLLAEGTRLEPGGSFNGRQFDPLDDDFETSVGRALELMYVAQTTKLSASSDYNDLYDALTQAVADVSCSWCDSDAEAIVEQACLAVQINLDSSSISNVPADYSTIQAAINAAPTDDALIRVAPGTYYENINFLNKNIVLTSENPNDPTVVSGTIVDGRGTGYTVTFSGSENDAAMLTGFTIQNGYYGCITSASGNPTPVISSNVIRDSDGAAYVYGIRDVDGVIDGNDIYGHYGTDSGAGIRGCNGTIRNNLVHGNSGANYSYGIRTSHGNIVSNEIYENDGVSARGLFDCDGTIDGNRIYSNEGSSYAYGLRGCDGTIQNNHVFGNDGVVAGRGVYDCDATIVNNTIVLNSHYGIQDSAATEITNNIIFANGTSQIANSTPTPNYCCISGWSGGGTGNFSTGPNLAGAATYKLLSPSPCIDAGTTGTDFDLDGDARPIDGDGVGGAATDIGADEYVP